MRVARGSIPYSAVTQPRPELRIHPGTPVSMEALQRTRVLPVSMRTEPSAVATKLGVKRMVRRASAARPSGRKIGAEDAAEDCAGVGREVASEIGAMRRL